MLKLRKNKKGFTLVELIVVIAIMAVLAGVVAGVTVSQLNKQKDKTGQTQAKQIADFIANCALTQDTADEADIKVLDENRKFKTDAITQLINDQYSATSIPVKESGSESGTITVAVASDKSKVTVTYNPKTKNGGATYEVTPDGIVKKGNTNASSGTNTDDDSETQKS